MKIIIIAMALFISGCATEIQRPEVYSLDGWYVVYNEDTFSLCGKPGCVDPRNKIIYCYLDDFIVCGHELKHATHGDWHRKK